MIDSLEFRTKTRDIATSSIDAKCVRIYIAALRAMLSGMDLRVLVGVMFLLLGAMLAVYGLWAPQDVAQRDLGIPVNLVWGCFLAVFGTVLAAFPLVLQRKRDGSRK
jgi:hypothetical protein